MFDIHDSLELVINITAFIPCMILIILYLIDFNKLKFPNYFKLELMIVILANISLNFVKNYNYKEEYKESGKSDDNYELNYCKKNMK